MDVPEKSNKIWTEVVTGKKSFDLKFLAAKILLGRVIHSVGKDPSSENISAAIDQLRNIYSKNTDIGAVQDDLKTIFGEEA